jgi:SAM-dependent MidA family methyltransferase
MQQNVTISRFQNAIIAKAYEKFCLTGPHISINMVELDKLAKETNLDPAEIDSQTRALKHLGLLSTGDTFSDHATWLCLDTYERNYPSDRVYANNKVRRLLFDIAYEHRNNQAGGYVSEETVYADQRVKELSEDIIYANVWFLQESGYAEGSLRSGMGFMYRIGDYALAIDKQKRAI